MTPDERPSVDPIEEEIEIQAGDVTLTGTLGVPDDAEALVIFAHGSGSSRHSPRNRHVAEMLREGGLGTLLMDLLTSQEEKVDVHTREYRFDIPLLAERTGDAVEWALDNPETGGLNIGLFGSSTGAAAAMIAGAEHAGAVDAVVSRGGRTDLAQAAQRSLKAPTLLIVGERDHSIRKLNEETLEQLPGEKALEIVPNAGHLFEEPGALDRVAELARDWFQDHLL